MRLRVLVGWHVFIGVLIRAEQQQVRSSAQTCVAHSLCVGILHVCSPSTSGTSAWHFKADVRMTHVIVFKASLHVLPLPAERRLLLVYQAARPPPCCRPSQNLGL